MKRWHVFTPIAVAVALFSTLALSQYGGGYSGRGGAVRGPVSSTDNAIARFDGTNGKVVQDSGVLVDDSDNVTGMGTLGAAAITTSGDLTFSNDDPNIFGGDTNGTLTLAPSTTNILGGSIRLYGDNHGSLAQDLEFYADATRVLSWDESEGNWDFDAESVIGVGTLNVVDDITADSFIPVDNVGALVSGTSVTHRGDGGSRVHGLRQVTPQRILRESEVRRREQLSETDDLGTRGLGCRDELLVVS